MREVASIGQGGKDARGNYSHSRIRRYENKYEAIAILVKRIEGAIFSLGTNGQAMAGGILRKK